MNQSKFTQVRSWLFTPGTRPDRFDKAAASGADVSIIDLEDAVAPADKAKARQTALAHLAQPAVGSCVRALRMNGLDTRFGLADLQALLESSACPDYLVLPKTESAAHLQILDRLLAEAGKATRLVALIESAQGLAACEAIAASTPRLEALLFGAADMSADLGTGTAWAPLAYARSRLIAACALAGVSAIDSPFFDVKDHEGLTQETSQAVALGFAGKAAIHPNQIAPINAALTPRPEEVARARAIVAENAKGVGVVQGQMVDEAVARKARRILAAAGETIPENKPS
ncbi:MAG TPA: itaconate degradation C-C-lyase RipC [Isosphaeraceae bacterium]|nr:itaconate degradation C-C-lyase RipC [Isosphaeraceae bacterium]